MERKPENGFTMMKAVILREKKSLNNDTLN